MSAVCVYCASGPVDQPYLDLAAEEAGPHLGESASRGEPGVVAQHRAGVTGLELAGDEEGGDEARDAGAAAYQAQRWEAMFEPAVGLSLGAATVIALGVFWLIPRLLPQPGSIGPEDGHDGQHPDQ